MWLKTAAIVLLWPLDEPDEPWFEGTVYVMLGSQTMWIPKGA